MKLLRYPGTIALIVGFLLILLAGWFFLWTWSAAALRCVECDCRYDLSAVNFHCRRPAVLNLLFSATFVGAILSFVVAWFQRRRAKRSAAAEA